MDRLARSWIVQRVVVYIKAHRDADSRRLSQVRDLLAAVAWEDLAPCGGCHLPFEKAHGFHCDECGRTIACSRACDPWAVFQCGVCKQHICIHCVTHSSDSDTSVVCQRCAAFQQQEGSCDSDV